MPFGLCNAAQRLVRLMDRVIPTEIRSNVFVYLDDLLILAPDIQTHFKYLRRVAECLKAAGLTIGMSKSKFCFKSLTYLGFIVGGGPNYRLARKLKSLCDHEMAGMKTADKLRVIQEKVRKNLETAYDRSRQRYDQRARNFLVKPGQEVYRRNFVLSDFGKSFNAKFARKFLKARVVKAVGNNAYELEDLQGRHLGVYHAKDIRV
ncbi:hypothetical protein KR084_009598 [Drosophila pseudotakahashii]|nr:hypothetical protein KR084_009598 [Drosophila pseudotakahashii]